MGILKFLLISAVMLSAALAETIECKGLIVPREQARMASRSQGVIGMIKDEGDVVKKGDVVMELENEMERLQVEQARHVLALRDFEWKSAEALRKKNVVSQTEGEEKRIALEVAKVQLAQAEQLLARRKVPAPFDGAVTERMREVGEAVDEFVPVLMLVHLDTMYLELFLPATRFRQIKEGQPVTVQAPDLPGRTFNGKVEKLSSVVNAASGEFKVRVAIPNPDHALVAGTYATAKIEAKDPAPASP
jgi:membrane fusion protein (multidrug efflux system)